VISSIYQRIANISEALTQIIQRWVKPNNRPLLLETSLDLTRSRSQLILENAFLRQQLIVLNRHVKRPALKPHERVLLVVLTSKLLSWKQALNIVQPDTLLRWHRDLYRWFWKRKSRKRKQPGRPPISQEIVALIQRMAKENRIWGAKRIRGELLKLGIRVAKSTIQRYINQARDPGSSRQSWRTFIHNHASEIWACDLLQRYDLFFRAIFVFVIIELGTRRIVHFGVTRHPTDKWLAQQLREATPFAVAPRFLIRDNDSKYGASFSRVAFGTGIEVLRTPYRAPKANAICERFLGSLQRECLDYFIILHERSLYRIVKEYTRFFNHSRPHQGLDQRIPCHTSRSNMSATDGKIVSFPVLGGLHQDYQRPED
jgi:putative transposase